MPMPSIPLVVSLMLASAAPAVSADAVAGETLDPARIDYCDPGLDLPTLLAGAERSLEQATAPGKRLAEARLMLFKASAELAGQTPGQAACRAVFKAGRKQFDQALSGNTRRLRREAKVKSSRDAAIAGIQARLASQWLQDQAGRMTYLEFLPASDSGGAAGLAQRLATAHIVGVDARSTELMRGLLQDHDWIDAVRFGAKTARQAWLLVQHADHDPDFQQLALARMAGHLDSGGVRPRDYAYLYDRVAVNTGQLQRYGTQGAAACNADGSLDLRPVEDPEQLDERRREVGLGPAAAQLAQAAAQRCPR